MAKKIKFTYDGKNYTLEFNRASVKQMEAQGFRIDEIEAKPLTSIQMLFSGAFIMHHKNVSGNKNLCSEIYDSLKNRDELITLLAEMYQEPLLSLLDEPEETEGNTSWGTE